MCIMTESDLVFARESANALEPIWELIYQVISGPNGLSCFRGCSRLGCGHCSGSRCWVTWLWWHNSSSWLLVSHLRVDRGWQDQGCLQHTNRSLPCGVESQGGLAAKWWAHRVHNIGVYGIHCRQWVWYWCDQGQWVGQLGWSDLDKGPLFCWHLQAAVWWCMPHCIVGRGHLQPLSL